MKQRRKEQGISHDKFAELFGCSVITLLKIEAVKRRASRQLAEILAAYHNIPADEKEQFIAFVRRGNPAADELESEIAFRAPWRAAHSHLTNLPSALTSYIGREAAASRA